MSTRSNCSSCIAAASASATTNASAVAERVVLDVDRAVGAARQRLADDLRDARRPGRADDHLAAVLLLQPQRLFERVGVRLVHLEAGVLLADPGLGVVQARLPLAGGDLFDADGDFHWSTQFSCRARRYAELISSAELDASSAVSVTRSLLDIVLNSSAAFVPPKPNEFDSAYSIGIGRACVAARSRDRTPDRASSRLMVGGAIWCVHRQRGDAGLEAAGGAEQVPGHRLGRRHRQLAACSPKQRLIASVSSLSL